MRPKLQNPWFPILALAALVLQIFDPARTWIVFFATFGGVTLAAFIWGSAVARKLHLTRERRVGWVQVGSQIEERLTLRNTAVIAAPWVLVRDHSTLPGYNVDTSIPLGAGEFQLWHTRGDCNQRGLYALGPADLETGDPFGIFRYVLHDSQQTSILILPSAVPLPRLDIAPAGFGGDGSRRTNSRESSLISATVREYQSSDSLRLIHWPTTARQGQFFVREFDSAPVGDWWILPDLYRGTRTGQGLDNTEEAVITLAASLLGRGLDEERRVGLLLNAAKPIRLAPQRGEAQHWEIMQALAVAKSSPIPLRDFLSHAREFIHQRASLLILTANVSADWHSALHPLAARGLVPTLLLVDPAGFGGASAKAAAEALHQRGLTSHIVPREALQPARQQAQQWKWKRSVSGEFIPVRVPISAQEGR